MTPPTLRLAHSAPAWKAAMLPPRRRPKRLKRCGNVVHLPQPAVALGLVERADGSAMIAYVFRSARPYPLAETPDWAVARLAIATLGTLTGRPVMPERRLSR